MTILLIIHWIITKRVNIKMKDSTKDILKMVSRSAIAGVIMGVILASFA